MSRSRWIATVVVAVLVVLASYLLGAGEPAPEPAPAPGPTADGTSGG